MSEAANPQHAIEPEKNITVSASAGTGKTYLLVARLIRLLMDGAKPGNILAVTFTRKAAGEMRERVQKQLWQLASCDEVALSEHLNKMGLVADEHYSKTARKLYEAVLFAEQPIRITTFHAFCQELLQRFPMEADIPPGFELLESNSLILDQAWDTLFKEATLSPNSSLSSALEYLFEACNGLNNTKAALAEGFFNQRSDWWAYTQNQTNPVQFASQKLTKLLTVTAKPRFDFINNNSNHIKEFSELLKKHPTKSNSSFSEELDEALSHSNDETFAFNNVLPVFLTKNLEPRKRTSSKTLNSKMGEAGANRFIQLHELISEQLLQTHELILNAQSLQTNEAWYLAGQQLLEHYQRIKREQRLLDFVDLEWKAYELLHQSDSAMWVQYKLDQKIDHLLIDEFQDTNPTQWQLILPILEEIASHRNERSRSVFIVGDHKQSIYGFRRANPELQRSASIWLNEQLSANDIPLSASWRSSPAIINFVNHIFTQTEASQHLTEFREHSTHQQDRWGYIGVLPLQTTTDADVHEATYFRNPLLEPRSIDTESAYYREGSLIADTIIDLHKQNIAINTQDQTRVLSYDDIFILFRNRTHIHHFEQALADKNIPFIGNKRDNFLESLEALDLEALLTFLTMPLNNLALAQTLRSPIFNVSDHDLMLLARNKHGHTWFERLQQLIETDHATKPLIDAYHFLSTWQLDAETLPTHDLLDRIYHQGNVLAKYKACTIETEQAAVEANLIRFIEMSLEIDSGRHPSTIKFLAQLKKLKQAQYEYSDSSDTGKNQSGVRLLTIHAAKGLEAPVIFLADTASVPKPKLSYKAITHWPTEHPRPEYFFLSTTQSNMPSSLKKVCEKQASSEIRESANLLYVALTRAQNILFISGSCNDDPAPTNSWYHLLTSSLDNEEQSQASLQFFQHSLPKTLSSPEHNHHAKLPAPDNSAYAFLHKQYSMDPLKTDAPENKDNLHDLDHSVDETRKRGILIHDYLSQFQDRDSVFSLEQLSSYLEKDHRQETIESCKHEVWHTIHAKCTDFLFNPDQYQCAYNEVPILYPLKNQDEVYGVIDRLVVYENEIWVIDYKTQRLTSPQKAKQQAAEYIPQLEKYREGVKKIWPDKTIKCAIIFTSIPHVFQLTD